MELHSQANREQIRCAARRRKHLEQKTTQLKVNNATACIRCKLAGRCEGQQNCDEHLQQLSPALPCPSLHCSALPCSCAETFSWLPSHVTCEPSVRRWRLSGYITVALMETIVCCVSQDHRRGLGSTIVQLLQSIYLCVLHSTQSGLV